MDSSRSRAGSAIAFNVRAFDLVPDGSDAGHVQSGRVGEHPFLVTLPGKDRAGVTAAHRDHHIGSADGLIGPRLGELCRDVDPPIGHRRDGGRVDLDTGFGAT